VTNTSSKTPRIHIPASGTYRLDAGRSTVTFRTRHLFGLAGVTGTMKVTSGEIAVDAAASRATVTVTLDAASFSSGHPKRDGDVRKARFLNVEKFPGLTFKANTLNQGLSGWELAGELTVTGVTNPVTLAIGSVQQAGRGFTATATTRIDRYAFGLTAAKGMAARYLDLEITAAAEPA
jgi:polyisoprenoid-binding protein YceI